jgi:hypothetical protein
MPISSTPVEGRQRLNTVIDGPLSLDDVRAHVQGLVDAGGFPCADLVDVRRMAGPKLTTAAVWSIVEQLQVLRHDGTTFGPRAMIVADDVTYGIARMFGRLIARRMQVGVFRDPDEAERWLTALETGAA